MVLKDPLGLGSKGFDQLPSVSYEQGTIPMVKYHIADPSIFFPGCM